ncbi:hypothetical protein TPHA_0F00370 [Tetrapisispora phaffii CBS 4417]|uniref:Uncharacterized protein n=1 Tax=Tetrapisispora phaffii (strain ATCC 24235 / CBS 4417 / NBRC 1672 / NRRL Y-8282 / UCD 70-5) TaxID=1071381 RepID=G8BUU2_TETPH|nr:hypothetical protein TPHA_0F00370 [Tetrapisispora phaffii CBS 4417]CCE63524.1 hypothetical protein TPHA_0F00370 [Tetrapisispora phaffii CBS 4417]
MRNEDTDLEFSWKFINENDGDDVLSSSSANSSDICETENDVSQINKRSLELPVSESKQEETNLSGAEVSGNEERSLATNTYLLICVGIGITILLESVALLYFIHFEKYSFKKHDEGSGANPYRQNFETIVDYIRPDAKDNFHYEGYLQQQLDNFKTGKYYIDFEKNIAIPLKNSTKIWRLGGKIENFNQFQAGYEDVFEYDFEKDVEQILKLIYEDLNLIWIVTKTTINHSAWLNNTIKLLTNISSKLDHWKINIYEKVSYSL